MLVSNSYGSATSSNAVLSILPGGDFAPPTFVFEIDSSAAPGGFRPGFMALDASNHLYVTDPANNRVVKFTAGGAYLSQWGSYGSSNGQFYYPEGIRCGRQATTYMWLIRSTTGSRSSMPTATISTNGAIFGVSNGQFNGPTGLAVDSSDNVYVADAGNYRVEKFTGNGGFIMQLGDLGRGIGHVHRTHGHRVADASNSIYVTDENEDLVDKFDDNGNYLAQWGSYGTNNGQFDHPEGIAVDGRNHVYVTEMNNDRVQKLDVNGIYLSAMGQSGKQPRPVPEPLPPLRWIAPEI